MLSEVPLFLTTHWAIISLIPAVIIGALTIVHQTISIYKLTLDVKKTKIELTQYKSDSIKRAPNPEIDSRSDTSWAFNIITAIQVILILFIFVLLVLLFLQIF